MESYIDIVKLKLKEEGYKLTPQRRSIVDIMIKNEGKHLNSEEIYDLVKVECPEIGLATVYRTLQLLDDIGAVSKLNLDDGCCRYEINLNDETHNHHHLICKKCNKIIEVEEDLLETLEEQIEKNYGFKIFDHDVKFFGMCNSCK
ncbi:Fur family transcriptional regulator [Tepidibacter hydrothermalis]|uniref:Fur family transcriptional regulator n=1 Tax=Tepidibacter hydrothermalis TaxID=3036126 RepID=A0ABY8EAH3_9FIRM|nr:Fur family transcriptional regulator [Tepidibacter hydrothermalis]WFD08804.1 Fur family transcriptional regulator [Tepidibacter hydrothermalis]